MDIEVSLGNRMRQTAGLALDTSHNPPQPYPWADVNNPHIQAFLESYQFYKLGQTMKYKRAIAFRAQTRRLAQMIIDRAEIISCTLSTAATPIITDSYVLAEELIINEAARVPENA